MRYLNRLLGALLSLFLIIAGVLLIIEVIANQIHHRPAVVHWHPFYNWAGRTQWQAGIIRFLCIALIVVGLILLVAEVKRPRVDRLRLLEETPGVDTAYTRRGLSAAVTAAVQDIDGVRGVSTKVRRRKVIVSATATATDKSAAEALREPVMSVARDLLDGLQLRAAPALSATVRPGGS